MGKSENLKDADELYRKVCKALKGNMNLPVPSKEVFLLTLKKLNALIEGHKSRLTAIGKL